MKKYLEYIMPLSSLMGFLDYELMLGKRSSEVQKDMLDWKIKLKFLLMDLINDMKEEVTND